MTDDDGIGGSVREAMLLNLNLILVKGFESVITPRFWICALSFSQDQ